MDIDTNLRRDCSSVKRRIYCCSWHHFLRLRCHYAGAHYILILGYHCIGIYLLRYLSDCISRMEHTDPFGRPTTLTFGVCLPTGCPNMLTFWNILTLAIRLSSHLEQFFLKYISYPTMSAFGAYTYPLSCPIILTFGAHCPFDHVHVWSILIHCLFIACPTTLTFGAYLCIVCSLSVRPCSRLDHTYPLSVHCPTTLTFGAYLSIVCSLSVRPC